MKKLLLPAFALLISVGVMNAKPVQFAAAKQVAGNYMRQIAGLSGSTVRSSMDLVLTYTGTSAAGETDYFVFNLNGNKGFVIVSAEDAGHPILGYSTEGTFDPGTAALNPEFNFWMGKRKKEIEYMRSSNVQADAEIKNEWKGYLSNTAAQSNKITPGVNTVAPLCAALWDQNGAYNDKCPGNSLTGCVATAMAIIMKKWAFPPQGKGQSSYASSYGTLSSNYGATTYNWVGMTTPTCSGSNPDVATLMFHCGVSVEMMYSPNGSGAFVCNPIPSAEHALPTYFKYDAGIHCVDQAANTTAAWIQLLKNELDAGRPMGYQGVDGAQGGHIWVCDGYDASNNFHMNWGWSGFENGYFAVTALHADGLTFTSELYALIGIQPSAATGIADNVTEEDFTMYPNPAGAEFTMEGSSTSETVHYSICNTLGAEVMSGNISAAGNNFSETIQVGGLSGGMYFLKVSDENGSFARKLNKL